MLLVSTLPYDRPLTISNGTEKISWIKKKDSQSIFLYRRIHFKDNKLVSVMTSKRLGNVEDEELRFRLDTGFRILL